MRLRPAVAATALAVVLATAGLTACSSDGPSSSTASTSAAADGTAALTTALKSGLRTLTTAHFTLAGTVGGQSLAGSGDQRVRNGELTGLQATAELPGGTGQVGLVIDGTDRYVRLPPALATSGKPWVRVTSSSGNVIVKQLSGVLDAAMAAANLGGLSDVAGAAKSVRKVGTEQVGGAPATRYDLVVDPAKLPNDLATTAGLGTADIPATIWLDAQNRPVRVRAKVPVAGQPVQLTVSFDKFGSPVTITPPSASEVAAG